MWEDGIKKLPASGFIVIKEIKRALNGEPFFYFKAVGEVASECSATSKEEWVHYFTIFHNCEDFGLPHGGGWLNELPWTIQFLSYMKYIKKLMIANVSAPKEKTK